MDAELRDALAGISGQVSNVATDAREAAARAREASSDVRQLTHEFGELKGQVVRLEKAVFGDDPPPPLSAPIVRRVTEGEGDIADLAGRVMRIESKVDAIHNAVVGVVKHPMAQRAAKLALAVLIGWLAMKQTGIHVPVVMP